MKLHSGLRNLRAIGNHPPIITSDLLPYGRSEVLLKDIFIAYIFLLPFVYMHIAQNSALCIITSPTLCPVHDPKSRARSRDAIFM